MTLTWRDEMNLLNDQQLKRIAFAEDDDNDAIRIFNITKESFVQHWNEAHNK